MKKWLKYEIINHKIVIICMLLCIYTILLPRCMNNLVVDVDLGIERLFTELKYSLTLLEIIFLYIFLRHILSGECVEVVFAIANQRKYLYFMSVFIIYFLICLPLFGYCFVKVECCILDILDCFFILILVGHIFYTLVFVSKTMLIPFVIMFLFIMICNHYSYHAIWNVFHPMIRVMYINRLNYVIYVIFGLIMTFIGIKLEKRYLA